MKMFTNAMIAICLVTLSTSMIHPQAPPPRGFGGQGARPRPSVSPYLNLLNGGDPGINYYGLVRPQVAFGSAISKLNGDVSSLKSSTSINRFDDVPLEDGHRSSFMTQGKYFMTQSQGGGAARSGAAGSGATRGIAGQSGKSGSGRR